ncbi:MAG TPA: DUF4097 family beta strand repeat-containing protein [Candidatus Baltobacteraceae bacterium]|nr:DUF4097 family beta strand repeat-containing protein [Candidatus Baltobacteraceae bacterium]
MKPASRTPLIAMLLAAELLIAGMVVYSLRGGHLASGFAGLHSAGAAGDFVAKTIAPIAVGNAPRVTIDDPDSGVSITASTDGMVHVKDDTYFSGMMWGTHGAYPQVKVTQDATGVHISRASYGGGWFSVMGDSRQHIEVQIPPAATLAIVHCDSAEIADLSGGTIAVHSDDGHIKASHVSTDSLQLDTDDGSVEALNLALTGAAPLLKLHSNDGHIRASGRFPAGGNYDLSTNDGHMYAELAPGSDVAIDASTSDGAIRVDGVRQRQFDHGDPASGTVRIGTGAAPMRLSTQDGSIDITTNGAE